MRLDAAEGSRVTPYAQWSYGWVLHVRAVMAEPNAGSPLTTMMSFQGNHLNPQSVEDGGTILNRLGVQVIALKGPESS